MQLLYQVCLYVHHMGINHDFFYGIIDIMQLLMLTIIIINNNNHCKEQSSCNNYRDNRHLSEQTFHFRPILEYFDTLVVSFLVIIVNCDILAL